MQNDLTALYMTVKRRDGLARKEKEEETSQVLVELVRLLKNIQSIDAHDAYAIPSNVKIADGRDWKFARLKNPVSRKMGLFFLPVPGSRIVVCALIDEVFLHNISVQENIFEYFNELVCTGRFGNTAHDVLMQSAGDIKAFFNKPMRQSCITYFPARKPSPPPLLPA